MNEHEPRTGPASGAAGSEPGSGSDAPDSAADGPAVVINVLPTIVMLSLALGLMAVVSLVLVWGSTVAASWLGLPAVSVLAAFLTLLVLLATMILGTSLWRSLRQLHERILTLAEQQQAMLLMLAKHTGIALETMPERGVSWHRPRRTGRR